MSNRQIVLDTETTGLEPEQGHRIIEIGAIELVNRRPSGNRYHQYVNPERPVEDGAVDVHGLSNDWLADKPAYRDIAPQLLAFLRGAELIIHNAPFDIAFLNAELAWLGAEWGGIEDYCRIHDSLAQARAIHPGQRNSLDALCKRYEVDNSGRDLHGALLDAELLAEVYLAMTGGQTALGLQPSGAHENAARDNGGGRRTNARIPVVEASHSERTAHEQRLSDIEAASSDGCVWLAATPASSPQS
jgi:DNA polymerase-3 subunit epsilon